MEKKRKEVKQPRERIKERSFRECAMSGQYGSFRRPVLWALRDYFKPNHFPYFMRMNYFFFIAFFLLFSGRTALAQLTCTGCTGNPELGTGNQLVAPGGGVYIGTITLIGPATFTVGDANNYEIRGPIVGHADITIIADQAGERGINAGIFLSGASNTYTGTVTVKSGFLICEKGVSAIAISRNLNYRTEANRPPALVLIGASQPNGATAYDHQMGGEGVLDFGTLASPLGRLYLNGSDQIWAGVNGAAGVIGNLELLANDYPDRVVNGAVFRAAGGVAFTKVSCLLLAGQGNYSFSGSIENAHTGLSPVGITKSGSGAQELRGNNSYTGDTRVTGGIFRMAGSGSLGYSATPTINNYAALLHISAPGVFENSSSVRQEFGCTQAMGNLGVVGNITGNGTFRINGGGRTIISNRDKNGTAHGLGEKSFTGSVYVDNGFLGGNGVLGNTVVVQVAEGAGIGGGEGAPTIGTAYTGATLVVTRLSLAAGSKLVVNSKDAAGTPSVVDARVGNPTNAFIRVDLLDANLAAATPVTILMNTAIGANGVPLPPLPSVGINHTGKVPCFAWVSGVGLQMTLTGKASLSVIGLCPKGTATGNDRIQVRATYLDSHMRPSGVDLEKWGISFSTGINATVTNATDNPSVTIFSFDGNNPNQNGQAFPYSVDYTEDGCTVSIHSKINPKVECSATQPSLFCRGLAFTMTVNNGNAPLTFESNDTAVATVNPAVNPTGTAPYTATVTAVAAGTAAIFARDADRCKSEPLAVTVNPSKVRSLEASSVCSTGTDSGDERIVVTAQYANAADMPTTGTGVWTVSGAGAAAVTSPVQARDDAAFRVTYTFTGVNNPVAATPLHNTMDYRLSYDGGICNNANLDSHVAAKPATPTLSVSSICVGETAVVTSLNTNPPFKFDSETRTVATVNPQVGTNQIGISAAPWQGTLTSLAEGTSKIRTVEMGGCKSEPVLLTVRGGKAGIAVNANTCPTGSGVNARTVVTVTYRTGDSAPSPEANLSWFTLTPSVMRAGTTPTVAFTRVAGQPDRVTYSFSSDNTTAADISYQISYNDGGITGCPVTAATSVVTRQPSLTTLSATICRESTVRVQASGVLKDGRMSFYVFDDALGTMPTTKLALSESVTLPSPLERFVTGAQAGTAYVFTSGYGDCKSEGLAMTVEGSPPIVDEIPDRLLCSGATVPAYKPTGSGVSAATRFQWRHLSGARDQVGLTDYIIAPSLKEAIDSFTATVTDIVLVRDVFVTAINGHCTSSQSVRMTVNPVPSFSNYPDFSICLGTQKTMTPVSQSEDGLTKPTGYSWSRDSGPDVGITYPAPDAHPLSLTFTSANTTATTSPIRTFINIAPYNSATGCSGVAQNVRITVSIPPTLSTSSVCPKGIATGNADVVITATYMAGSNKPINFPVNPWTFGNTRVYAATPTVDNTAANPTVSFAGQPSVIEGVNTIYRVSYNDGHNCVATLATRINHLIKLSASAIRLCQGVSLTAYAESSNTPISFETANAAMLSVNPTALQAPPWRTTVTAVSVGTAAIKAIDKDGCKSAALPITVFPTPILDDFPALILCPDQVQAAWRPASTGAVGNTIPDGFQWALKAGAAHTADVGLADERERINQRVAIESFTARNTTLSVQGRDVQVWAYNTSTGCTVSKDLHIRVNPAPTISAVGLNLCAGPYADIISVSGDNTGLWAVYDEGGAAVNPFVISAVNGAAGKGTLTVAEVAAETRRKVVKIGSNSCGSRAITFTISPSPLMNAINNRTLCANFPQPSITPRTTGTGLTAPVSYQWQLSPTAVHRDDVGLPDYSVDWNKTAIDGFMAKSPLLNVPARQELARDISVTPRNSAGCLGIPQTFTITVRQELTVTADNTKPYVCSGTATLIGLGTVGDGITYSWTSVSSANLSGNGRSEGVGRAAAIEDNLTLTDKSEGWARYSITANGANCIGVTREVTVYVDPVPVPVPVITVSPVPITTVSPPAAQTVCNNTETNITLDNDLGIAEKAHAKYSWTVTDNVIGATASVANAPAFAQQRLSHTTHEDASVTYTFTAWYQPANRLGCVGAAGSLVYTVTGRVSKPQITGVTDRSICLGETAVLTTNAQGGRTAAYRWKRNGVEIEGATSTTYTAPTTAVSESTYTVSVSNVCRENETSDGKILGVTEDAYFTNGATAAAIAASPSIANVGDTVRFSYTGPAADYRWDFGDGTSASTVRNPTHRYAKVGAFGPSLKATKPNNTACTKTFTISPMLRVNSAGYTSISEPNGNKILTVFPIPAKNQLTVQSTGSMSSLTLSDLSGRNVWSASTVGHEKTVDISSLSIGIYILTIVDSQGVKRMKISKD